MTTQSPLGRNRVAVEKPVGSDGDDLVAHRGRGGPPRRRAAISVDHQVDIGSG